MTLVPAYGRDYKSAKAAKEDFLSGKDFIIQDISSRWDGKPANVQDFQKDGTPKVMLRFCGLRKIAMVAIPKGGAS